MFSGNFLGNNISSQQDVLKYFIKYNEADWEYNSGGVIFYNFKDNTSSLLIQKMIEKPLVSLSSTFHDKTWHTLNNEIAINNFVDVSCQEFVSLGTFIPIEIAKVVIENFFENPFSLSNETKWIETTKIDWNKL